MNLTKNKFCTISCSTKFNNTLRSVDSRKQQSQSLKKYFESNPNVRDFSNYINRYCIIKYTNCIVCDKIFIKKSSSKRKCCSDICKSNLLSKNARISIANQVKTKRSKNEIYFSDLCKSKFVILTNNQMFNGWDADIIIPNLKIAILWNGN